jgi:pseudouridine-5'-phosphate glycosidase
MFALVSLMLSMQAQQAIADDTTVITLDETVITVEIPRAVKQIRFRCETRELIQGSGTVKTCEVSQ